MKRYHVFSSLIGISLIMFLNAGCSAPAVLPTAAQASSTPAATPMQQPSPSVTPQVEVATATPKQAPPEHRIAIRQVDGVGEFYDRQTGEKFIPRGNNYVQVTAQQDYSGNTYYNNSTFNTNLYSPQGVEAALSAMQAEGYNVVRVFIQGNCKDFCVGDPIQGLRAEYIANLVDFLVKAKSHGLYVIFTGDPGGPASPYYIHQLDTTWSTDFGGTNKIFLTGGGFLVSREYWGDLIEALLSQNAPMDAILAYELTNELFYEANATPLSFTSGSYKTFNGKTYDMSSAEERQRMMDENLLLWIDQVRSVILERDPTALVTTGFFVPQAPTPTRVGDSRLIETYPVIWESSLDFIDLHPYPGFDLNLAQYAENFGMLGMEAKPIIMGEFGAVRSSYSTVDVAARAMQDWQVESCQYGFDGWLLWTYDMPDQVFYNGVSGSGQIDQVLAPVNRPDPCQPGKFDFFEYDLALGAHTEASRSLPNQLPSGAVDGNANQWWGAGAFAPQWIMIDLGSPQTIASIRLTIAQSPAGETVHQVWVGASIDDLYLLHTFDGTTIDGQVLEYKPESPLEDVRFVRVNTRQSPSWVGWKEIEVLAP
jgi:hypothetical protein